MSPPVDLADVVDPDVALEISTRGVAAQRREEQTFRALLHQIDALRAEDHVAERLENLLRLRR